MPCTHAGPPPPVYLCEICMQNQVYNRVHIATIYERGTNHESWSLYPSGSQPGLLILQVPCTSTPYVYAGLGLQQSTGYILLQSIKGEQAMNDRGTRYKKDASGSNLMRTSDHFDLTSTKNSNNAYHSLKFLLL